MNQALYAHMNNKRKKKKTNTQYKKKGGDRVAQVGGCLSSKCEALSANPSTNKEKKSNPGLKRVGFLKEMSGIPVFGE
jgi:hypothetical protein